MKINFQNYYPQGPNKVVLVINPIILVFVQNFATKYSLKIPK